MLTVYLALTCLILGVRTEFTLTVTHNNDIHAHFEKMDSHLSACSAENEDRGLCYGGFARLATKMREINRTEPNVLNLNAGDYYQGTVWYTLLKWNVVKDLVSRLPLHAIALGNHEFDDGVKGLIPFVRNLPFPVLCANIDTSRDPEFGKWIKKSIVIEIGRKKIGIIGYITPETAFLSQPNLKSGGSVNFTSDLEAIRTEAIRLTSEGIDIIIALGHSGLGPDKLIAQEIPEVDLVVGGHSHSFLYTGASPIKGLTPVGPYPVVVTRNDSSTALVVTDFKFGMFLGYLKVTFDDKGHVQNWTGSPILLDNSTMEDPDMLKVLQPYKEKVANQTLRIVGNSSVFLDDQTCRMEECALGNLLTDSLIYAASKTDGLKDVKMAVWNGGAIRSPLPEGNIVLADIMTVAPFENTVNGAEMNGSEIYKMFEHSVSQYDLTGVDQPGAFLQVSGIKIQFDVLKPAGKRVVSLETLCPEKCAWVPIEDEQIYKIIMSDYLLGGGDGYNMQVIKTYKGDLLDTDIVQQYIAEKSPISASIEGRVTFTHLLTSGQVTGGTTVLTPTSVTTLIILTIYAFI